MPTVMRLKGYRFFFFSSERREPPHIHVEKGDGYAKFWLDPVALTRSRSFASQELTEVAAIVARNKRTFLEKWNEHFSA